MYSLILHGRRSLESHKLRHLGVSLQKAFAFSNSFCSATPKVETFSVSYLVDSLGLTTKLAESIWRQVSSEGKGNPNPDSVLSLLRSHGFTDSHISTIVSSYPKLLLIEEAEKSIGPKLKFLQSRGADDFTDIVSKVPKILGVKSYDAISRYYDIVKEIVEADNKSSKHQKLCHSSLAEGSGQENKIRNLLVLRDLGVPQRLLFSLLISNFATLCGKERFQESLKKVIEMGFDPTSSSFVQALNTVYAMTDESIEEKVHVYKRLGFDVADVWALFKKWPLTLRYSERNILNSFETFIGLGFTENEFVMMVKSFPPCIGLSAETVRTKTDFLVKKMNWPLKAVVTFPPVLGYSMEKRIVTRCEVFKALRSKGLLGSELPSLSSMLACTDKVFLERYVKNHDDIQLVAELMAIFTEDQAL